MDDPRFYVKMTGDEVKMNTISLFQRPPYRLLICSGFSVDTTKIPNRVARFFQKLFFGFTYVKN